MKKLSFLIIVLLLLGHPYSAFASKVCNNFFSSTLLILRNDYLPVFIEGENKEIAGLGNAAIQLLERNSSSLEEVKWIRKRHTHPDAKGQNIITHGFSDGDMNSDQIFREYLNKNQEYKKIKFESWIIYLDPNITHFIPGELRLHDVRIRGYQVNSNI